MVSRVLPRFRCSPFTRCSPNFLTQVRHWAFNEISGRFIFPSLAISHNSLFQIFANVHYKIAHICINSDSFASVARSAVCVCVCGFCARVNHVHAYSYIAFRPSFAPTDVIRTFGNRPKSNDSFEIINYFHASISIAVCTIQIIGFSDGLLPPFGRQQYSQCEKMCHMLFTRATDELVHLKPYAYIPDHTTNQRTQAQRRKRERTFSRSGRLCV